LTTKIERKMPMPTSVTRTVIACRNHIGEFIVDGAQCSVRACMNKVIGISSNHPFRTATPFGQDKFVTSPTNF